MIKSMGKYPANLSFHNVPERKSKCRIITFMSLKDILTSINFEHIRRLVHEENI